MNPDPSWIQTLQESLAEAQYPFEWPGEESTQLKEALLESWGRYPFNEELQQSNAERIARCTVLAVGPSRQVRLTEGAVSSFLFYDPASSEKVFLSLGPNFPPLFWPSAALTASSLRESFGPYLERPCIAAPKMSRSLRIGRGELQRIGVKDLASLADIIAETETWIDEAYEDEDQDEAYEESDDFDDEDL